MLDEHADLMPWRHAHCIGYGRDRVDSIARDALGAVALPLQGVSFYFPEKRIHRQLRSTVNRTFGLQEILEHFHPLFFRSAGLLL
jgi:hypothetical protein